MSFVAAQCFPYDFNLPEEVAAFLLDLFEAIGTALLRKQNVLVAWEPRNWESVSARELAKLFAQIK